MLQKSRIAAPPIAIRRCAGTRKFAAPAQLLLVLSDVAVLGASAAGAVALTGRHGGVGSALTAVTLFPLWLWMLGLYAGSFVSAPRDEIYALALPFCLTLAAVLVIAAVPGTRIDVATGVIAASLGFAGCALARAVSHERLLASSLPDTRARTSAVPLERGGRFLKRLMDVVLALTAAPLAAGIGVLVALLIVADDRGPILFEQERVGLDGRPFRLLKFRTMRVAAGEAWAVAGDARVTRAGRFLRRTSLDELPQLINVLRGDISLVGPRPEMVSYARDFAHQLPRYAERHRVKPGITGWAQVMLPRILRPDDMAEVLTADLFYVEHCSIALDGMIIAKTAAEVLFHRAG